MSTHFLKHWPFTYVRLSTICETGLRSGILCSMILRKNIRPHLKSRSLKKFYDKNIDLFFLPSNLEKKKYRIKAFPLYNRCKGLFATNYTRKFFMGKIGEFIYSEREWFWRGAKTFEVCEEIWFFKRFFKFTSDYRRCESGRAIMLTHHRIRVLIRDGNIFGYQFCII